MAFNLQLAPPATIEDARAIASRIREGGSEGLPGVRAIGVQLQGSVAQVSMNVERPFELPLAAVVEAVSAHAPVASAELVGLAPAAAMSGFPGGGADARLRPRTPHDRERTRLLAMAQTQPQAPDQAPGERSRRGRVARAHRTQADSRREGAGRVDSKAKKKQLDREDKPPTWKGAFVRAMFAAVMMLAILLIFKIAKAGQAIALFPIVLLMYMPISYYTERWMYKRRQLKKARRSPRGRARRRRRDERARRPRLHRRPGPGELLHRPRRRPGRVGA